MDVNSIYRKKEDSVTRQIADETFLVPIRSHLADMQKIFTLDSQVAEYIWQQLDGKRNLEEIHREITAEFEVENGQVKRSPNVEFPFPATWP